MDDYDATTTQPDTIGSERAYSKVSNKRTVFNNRTGGDII